MKESIKLLAFAFLTLAACTPKADPDPDPDPDPDGKPLAGETVILPADASSPVTLNYNISGSWQVYSRIDWLQISPLSGFSGDSQLTLSARSANTGLAERTGSFDIIVNGTQRASFYAVQEGAEGLELLTETVSANGAAGQVVVYVNTNTEFTAEFDQNWAKVADIEYGLSSNTLDDGVTVSKLQMARISLEVEANPGSSMRSGTLEINCGGQNYSVAVRQGLTNDSEIEDFDSPFFRRTLAMRFTATWCGYCPRMAEAYKQAISANPDRLIPMSIHSGNSEVYSENGDEIASKYRVSAFPTGIVNAYAEVQNYDSSVCTEMISGLVDEAVEKLPAKTAISAVSETSGGKFRLMCTVATKEALPYRLHVYLLEDGIVNFQNGGGNNYVHDYVERCAVTGDDGMVFYGMENDVVNSAFEYTLPDVFDDIDNAYAVVYVTYDTEDAFNGSVTLAKYRDFGHIVDNVIKVPLNGKTDFEYEN